MNVTVTIIVPIYNSAKYLRRCLDSLVYQTLENYEILAINNGSTDESESILKEYELNFSKIFHYHTIKHTDFIAPGRNYGIKNAKGKFIGFCDSDDYVDLNYYKNLYDEAIKRNCEITYSPFYYHKDGVKIIAHSLEHCENAYDLIMYANMSTWNKLYKTEFIQKMIQQPEDFCFEDYAWFMTIASYSKNIGYMPVPGYHYIIRSNSESTAFASEKTLGLIKACKFCEEHCNKKYLDIIRISNLQKSIENLDTRWQHYASFMQYIHETVPKLSPSSISLISDKCYFKLKSIKEYTPTIKRIISMEPITYDKLYINGIKNKVVSLDQSKEEPYDLLMDIYNNGGIWISNKLSIDSPLNRLFFHKLFFAYTIDGSISEDIFGAEAKCDLILKIAETYLDKTNLYNTNNVPLCKRIKIVLEKNKNSNKDSVLIYPANVFMYDITEINNLDHGYHYSHLLINNDPELKSFVNMLYHSIREDSNKAAQNNELSIQIKPNEYEALCMGKTVQRMIEHFPFNALYRMYRMIKK